MTVRPAYGLDRCDVWRPAGALGVEVVSASIFDRAFAPRLSLTLGVCLKVGRPHVAVSDGETLEVAHDTVILRPPGCVWASKLAPVGFLSIDISAADLPEDATFGAMTVVPRDAISEFARVLRVLRRAEDAAAHGEAASTLVAAVARLGFLRSQLVLDTTSARRLRRARAFLRENLHRPVSLEELSTHCAVNKFVLLRRFRHELGLTPHVFHLQLRVHEARDLLARGLSTSEVTFRTGFADQSHFGRWFKRIVGVSPGAYARSVRSTSWIETRSRRSADAAALVEEELT
jgi:AraC-like DNA-binding protein